MRRAPRAADGSPRRGPAPGWAEREPEALAELARNPLLEIGNHAWSHPRLTRLAPARIREELLRARRAIAARTGRVPTLFRPSYGEYDAAVLRAAAEVGLAARVGGQAGGPVATTHHCPLAPCSRQPAPPR